MTLRQFHSTAVNATLRSESSMVPERSASCHRLREIAVPETRQPFHILRPEEMVDEQHDHEGIFLAVGLEQRRGEISLGHRLAHRSDTSPLRLRKPGFVQRGGDLRTRMNARDRSRWPSAGCLNHLFPLLGRYVKDRAA